MAAEQLPEPVRRLLYGRADYTGRCECTGQCGRQHARGRCDAEDPYRPTFAPADPSIPLERAAALPLDELIEWCRPCRDKAVSIATRERRERLSAELAEAQGELDLWGAA